MRHDKLKKVFEIEKFRSDGHLLIDQLAEYLNISKRGYGPVTQYRKPEDELAYWKKYPKQSSLDGFVNDLVQRSIRIHHPNYVGHQVSVPVPETALIGLVSDLINNGMGIYEMGQAPTALERLVTDHLCKTIGYSNNSGGFLTSGGTLANLTSLLAARSRAVDYDERKSFILVSDQAHYCIDRAARTMGLGTNQVVKVKTDKDYRIEIEALKASHRKIVQEGGRILSVVGCACTTSTGSYDDLEALAGFCRRHNYWFHIDAAHGGAALFSAKYRHHLNGVKYADSIIIDAHKMMLTPALATFVLFKDQKDGYANFAENAAYLFEESEPEWFQLTKRTYETTKYMMSAKIFWLLHKYGDELFDEYVTRQYDLALDFAELIDSTADFETACVPSSNIVCFRYNPRNIETRDLNEINRGIRKLMLEDGQYYLVQTLLKGKIYLRTSLMNPHTGIITLERMLEKCRNAVGQIPGV